MPTTTTTDRATCPEYASFDRDWSTEAYLRDYYREVQPDEDVTMRFLVEAAALVGEVPALLEFGCGPTVHHLLPFAPRIDEFHLADYLARNLDDVRTWVDGRDGAWDWSPFTELTLRHELGRAPQPWEIRDREAATRERVRSFQLADARLAQPLANGTHRYPAVLCCFCPDSITADIDEWRRYTENVASLVAPGGWFVLTALGGADRYRVGERSFPSPRLEVDDIADVLRCAGFSRLGTSITPAHSGDTDDHGFEAVLLAVSRKL